MEAQQPVTDGTSAAVRTRSGACEIDVALTAAAVSGVRVLVSACLRLWGLTELDWRVTLTASEMLTNAFQHARKEDESSVPVKVVLTRTPTGSSCASVTRAPCSQPLSRQAPTTRAVAA